MTEGVISSWIVKLGDQVEPGDILAEVETDKATMELESYETGKILHIAKEANEPIAVDSIIAVVGEEGEDYAHLLNDTTAAPAVVAQEATETSDTDISTDVNTPDLSQFNANAVTMPLMSDTMTEGKISSWLVKVGDDGRGWGHTC